MDLLFGDIISKFEVFLLVLVRMTGLFLMSPVFGRQNMPAYLKLGLSFFISYMVFGNRFMSYSIEINSFFEFGLIIIKEVLVGLTMGYITTLFFSAIWTAGQMIDTQIGFGIVNAIDPQYSIQVPITGNFKNIIALFVFFILNGHHTLIKLILGSYDIVPLGDASINRGLVSLIVKLFSESFILAVKIALPIVAIAFLSEVAFGILVKTVPQMNIFIIGIPMKIFLGLVAVLLFIPIYIGSLNGVFDGMFGDIGRALKGMVSK